jgi:hypothetical protein
MERKDKFDIVLKTIALIGAIVSFFYGIYNYKNINKDDSAKAFWNQQFPIYKDLCSSAATIATSKDSLLVQKATDDFWRMYYGEARMVVDWGVHKKMSQYASILKDFERGFKSSDELTLASYELATQCRKSLSESWNIPLSELSSE